MDQVSLPEAPTSGDHWSRWDQLQALITAARLRPREIRGGLFTVDGMFLVQDGFVRRKGLLFGVVESPFSGGSGELRDGAFISVSERGAFAGRRPYDVEGAEDWNVLIEMPHCTSCWIATATLASGIDSRFRSISSLNFGCLDGWKSCSSLDQLVDLNGAWRPLVEQERAQTHAPVNDETAGCRVPTAVLTRDAMQIVLVEATEKSRPVTIDPKTGALRSETSVRTLAIPFGSPSTTVGDLARLQAVVEGSDTHAQMPLALSLGEKVVLLISSWNAYQEPGEFLDLHPCEIAKWNRTTQAEIERGLALRDPIRGPEPSRRFYDFERNPEWRGRF
jgi:hypothetical protein